RPVGLRRGGRDYLGGPLRDVGGLPGVLANPGRKDGWMSEAVLTVEGLSKKYCRSLKRALWYGVKDLASELLLRRGPRTVLRPYEFWALKDVSLELRPGE